MSTQNEGLNTHMWKVFSSKVDGPGKLTSVAIDEQFRDKISETGSSIFFQFGKILVHGLRKSPEEIKEGEDIGDTYHGYVKEQG